MPGYDQSSPSAIIDTPLHTWHSLLTTALKGLHHLAETTEVEFLEVGARMQIIHAQAADLAETSIHLLEVTSGEHLHALIARLREIVKEMEGYLGTAQDMGEINRTTFASIGGLLHSIRQPLAGVKSISKHLYTLEVLIKIESAHLGDEGSEFVNLAIDIKKLSQQIKEKFNIIIDIRTILGKNLSLHRTKIETTKRGQDNQLLLIHTNTTASLCDLEDTNNRLSDLGTLVSSLSQENSNNISIIVESLQFHDIYRQQVEHVIEALESLATSCSSTNTDGLGITADRQALVREVGDICELQQAQLQFASKELYQAVTDIIDNLQSIGVTQKQMAGELLERTGSVDAGNSSFIDKLSGHMQSLTDLLGSCAKQNAELTDIVRDVTGTIKEITGFVSDIEGIGHDIIQIALNARIKAASTGQEGASLSVLAEEIGFLSNEAVEHTNLIGKTLGTIESETEKLNSIVKTSEENLAGQLSAMKDELDAILTTLNQMGSDLLSLLKQVKQQASGLTKEISSLTGSIDIHEKTKTLADKVLDNLATILGEARQLAPASSAFQEDLQFMAARYTMESERRIHEAIARRQKGVHEPKVKKKSTPQATSVSEFGDNVDLF